MSFSFFRKTKALIFKIENHSINIVLVAKVNASFELKGAYFEALSVPAFDKDGSINDSRNIWAVISKMLKKAGIIPESQDIKQDITSLGDYDIGIIFSDSHIYISRFEVEDVSGKKLEDQLLSYCVSNFPIDKEDIVFEFRLDPPTKSESVKGRVSVKKTGQIIAIDNGYVRNIRSVFADKGIIVNNFIANSIAYASLYYEGRVPSDNGSLALVDLSFSDMSLSFFKAGRLIYSRSIAFGLKDIEDEVSRNITDKSINVRNLILYSGLKDINKKETHLLVKASDVYLDHIKETVAYMESSLGFKLEEIVLAGFGALIPGMPDYIGVNIGKKISPLISSIWLKDESNQASRILYAGMIGAGLALLGESSKLSAPIINVEKLYKTSKEMTLFGKFQSLAGINLSTKKTSHSDLINIGNEKNKTVEQLVEGDQKPIDIKSYKKLLVIIAVSGLVLIVGAFFIRIAINSMSPKKVLVTELRHLPYNKDVVIELPVALEPLQFSTDRVRGRVLQIKVARESDYLSTQKKALSDATALLLSGEKIWDVPILSAQANENPARFNFAVFNSNEAISLAESSIKSKIKTSDYEIGEVKFLDLQATDNNAIYLLKISVNVGSGQIIDDSSGPDTQPTPETNLEEKSSQSQQFEENIIDDTASASKKIQDKATFRQYKIKGDGTSVNLRSAASANSFLLTQLNDGEIVDYVSDKDGWTKIITKEGDEGWIKSGLLINDLR